MLELTFEKERLYKNIYLNSYYRGEREKENKGVLAAIMQAGEDNKDVLEKEVRDALTEVGAVICTYLGRCVYENRDDVFVVKIACVRNYPQEMVPVLKDAMEALVGVIAIQQWLLINNPGEAEFLENKKQSMVAGLKRVLLERKKPI